MFCNGLRLSTSNKGNDDDDDDDDVWFFFDSRQSTNNKAGCLEHIFQHNIDYSVGLNDTRVIP